MSTRLCITFGAFLAVAVPTVAVRPVRAALSDSACPQCGRVAPAFLAGLKCYHCGAALPQPKASASPAAAASPAPGASPAGASPAATGAPATTAAPSTSATPAPDVAPARSVWSITPAGKPAKSQPAKPATEVPKGLINLGLRQPPDWFHARLPSSGFTVRPPASHEKVEREVRIPADGLAPAGTARAGSSSSIPLPNGPYSAVVVSAEHHGSPDASAALIYVEVLQTDGTWWARVMKVTPGSGTSHATLRTFWPPAPFTELRLSGLDITGHFTQGAALIHSVQVQK